MTERHSYRCSETSAGDALAAGRAVPVVDGDGRLSIQLVDARQCAEVAAHESIGRSNILPFTRGSNPLLAPDKFHYEIPRAGDRGIFARHRRRRIRVSGRSQFAAAQAI